MSKKTKNKDQSVFVPQDDKINFQLNIRERTDLTEKQIEIIKTMVAKDTKCVFIDGLWGTSKSFCSILSGLKLLNTRKSSGIIYIRNPVEASSTGKTGFLPGGLEEKMAPYNAVLFEKMSEFISKDQLDLLVSSGKVECIPLGFVRGRSWNCKTIIVDEASSMTYDDLFLLLSRCGEFTKIFFIGDSCNQNDIGNKSGFKKMIDQFNDQESRENGIFSFELKSIEDIVRSGFVRFVMKKLGKIQV